MAQQGSAVLARLVRAERVGKTLGLARPCRPGSVRSTRRSSPGPGHGSTLPSWLGPGRARPDPVRQWDGYTRVSAWWNGPKCKDALSVFALDEGPGRCSRVYLEHSLFLRLEAVEMARSAVRTRRLAFLRNECSGSTRETLAEVFPVHTEDPEHELRPMKIGSDGSGGELRCVRCGGVFQEYVGHSWARGPGSPGRLDRAGPQCSMVGWSIDGPVGSFHGNEPLCGKGRVFNGFDDAPGCAGWDGADAGAGDGLARWSRPARAG